MAQFQSNLVRDGKGGQIKFPIFISQADMDLKVQNKVIAVTGGGNGIGRELVLHLLARGAGVAAIDINGPALQETVEFAGNNR